MKLIERLTAEAMPVADEGQGAFLADLILAQPSLTAVFEDDYAKRLTSGIFGASPYLRRLILSDGARYERLMETSPSESLERVFATLDAPRILELDEAGVRRALRLAKQELALLTALCDLGGVWPLAMVTEVLTRFADKALHACLTHILHESFSGEEGAPEVGASGYVLLAMGKYGAGELNYSSDIDVIALFDPEARTPRGKDPQTFFVRLTQKMVSLMQEQDENGYVFRTDLRLRPDPGATKVAISFPAAMHYYETLGQNWERAAMIKARPCAGDMRLGGQFIREIAPFIWRKYLDFASLQDIHAMKRQIHAAKGFGEIAVIGHNLKLGRGGIREIEFFAQTQQLIAGGRNPDLRICQTEAALKALYQDKWFDKVTLDDLIVDYRALRTWEHRIQMLNDEQSHTLPKTREGFASYARFCGFSDAKALEAEIEKVLRRVAAHYDELFAQEDTLGVSAGSLVFTGDSPDPDTVETFSKLGFERPVDAVEIVRKWHYGRYRATQTAKARELLTALTPQIITAFSDSGAPDQAILNFDAMLSRLPSGLQFFGLLHANPSFLNLLINILSLAPQLTNTIIKRPHVVDAVLDPGFFNGLHDRDDLKATLERALAPATYYEDILDRVRYFAQEQRFMVGVLHLSRSISSRAAAKAYSDIASVIIERLLKDVLNEFAIRHGHIKGARLAVIGMGRLGSETLSYSSDLDVIFIYDHAEDAEASDGKKPLDPLTYFTRLAQRFTSALSAPTAAGTLYEVDMRLRPSGHSGPLATSFSSFAKYQAESAWTWEHLALTKAKVTAGEPTLSRQLDELIDEVICRPRDVAQTLADVRDMRERLHKEKPAKSPLDVKNGPGGLMDMEFMAQSLMLLFGHAHREYLHRDSALALLNAADDGLIDKAVIAPCAEAYETMQSLLHLTRLTTASAGEEGAMPAALEAYVSAAFNQPDLSSLSDFINDERKKIEAAFEPVLTTLGQKAEHRDPMERTHPMEITK